MESSTETASNAGATIPESNRGRPRKVRGPKRGRGEKGMWDSVKQQKYLYFMSIPFVIWVFVFSYLPLWGWTMAFQNYKPAKSFWIRSGWGWITLLSYFRTNVFIWCCAIRWR